MIAKIVEAAKFDPGAFIAISLLTGMVVCAGLAGFLEIIILFKETFK